MTRYEVYIEGQLIDLNPNQVIGQTLQAWAIANGDLVSRIANYTNQFTVPLTNNNIAIFGQANFLRVRSTSPYIKKSCRIRANGIQILEGVAIIKACENNFNLQVYSVPKDISLLIGNKVLSDLDFGDSPITWDAAFWDSRRAATTGWCCPVIEYGQVKKTIANGTIGDFYLPSIAVKDIVTAIFENIGYTVSGDFYDSDEFFNNMVLTYSRKDWQFSGDITMGEVLSDEITQAQFLNDLQVKFGAWFRPSGRNVEIVLIEDVLNDKAGAVDWSSKRIKNILDSVQFAWNDWSQVNKFKYPNPVKYLVPVTDSERDKLIFDGQLTCLNEDIDLEKTIYESIFSPCQLSKDGYVGVLTYNIAGVSSDIFCATQRVWETEPSAYLPFDNEPLPMLLLLRDRDVSEGEGSIIYDSLARTDYKVAYFARTAYEDIATNVLRWSGVHGETGLLDRYYSTLGTILNKGAVKVTRYYKLNDLDIYQFDPLKLIFDDGDYFLVNKIFDYVSGFKTKVELLRATFIRERTLVESDTGELVLEGFAPDVVAGAVVLPGIGSLLIDGFAPSVYTTIAYDVIAERNSAITSEWNITFTPNGHGADAHQFVFPPGTSGSGSATIPSYGGVDVDILVSKQDNGGLAEDAGTIEFYLNGSLLSGDTVNFILNDDVSGITYSFVGLTEGDELKVVVNEG